MPQKIAIIGAGPAGLTAAYLLAKAGRDVTIFEKDDRYVGGISRTETYKGYLFDIGGHRFFSKSDEVEDLWTEILGDDLLRRPRSSRMYYRRKFFDYPLRAGDALKKLGIVESARCILSYSKAKCFPVKHPANLEDWVSNQFGRRLYRIFFKTYTEKVWGISCRDISADWAAQRIKGLSLASAIRHALFKTRRSGNDTQTTAKTLIETFRYPRKGPGMMWERCLEKSIAFGATIEMNACIQQLSLENNKWSLQTQQHRVFGDFDHVLSSAPLRELIAATLPRLPEPALDAARHLQYRDFITVVLICKEEDAFRDNWIYIHEPGVKVGRIQNFKSWSPEMVPHPSMACYGLEYFCFEGDQLWLSTDDQLIELAKREMQLIGLTKQSDITDACVVRQPKAYPVYDHSYKANVATIRQALTNYPGLILIGRNGMHKYNNQDHSMVTAMLAVRNILAGQTRYDLWNVNTDALYHEEVTADAPAATSSGHQPQT